ncbi:MAG: hypothetical protein LC749_01575 [Actinobacteria bacterium]|nr:hypothetical protein [Actinomycetota bacterium]
MDDNSPRAAAIDAAVQQLSTDLALVENIRDEGRRAQARAAAEQAYLAAVRGPTDA